jgi:hypothetical protein
MPGMCARQGSNLRPLACKQIPRERCADLGLCSSRGNVTASVERSLFRYTQGTSSHPKRQVTRHPLTCRLHPKLRRRSSPAPGYDPAPASLTSGTRAGASASGWRTYPGPRSHRELFRRPDPTTWHFDGSVHWRTCLSLPGERCENIAVMAIHFRVGPPPATTWAIADRLVQPAGTWQPFRPPPFLRPAFPRSDQSERPRPAPPTGPPPDVRRATPPGPLNLRAGRTA